METLGDPPKPAPPRPNGADHVGAAPADPESGVLKPADQELLTAAIRAGMVPEPPSLSSIVRSILFVVAVGVALMGVYRALQRWRPAIPLTLTADQTVASQQITFGAAGGNGPMRWKVTSAFVGSMQVTGPESDTVEIDVPLPVSACSQVAAELGALATCVQTPAGAAPHIELASPLSVAWASPTHVQLLPPPGDAFHRSTVLGVTVTSAGVGTTMPSNGQPAVTANGGAGVGGLAPSLSAQQSAAGTGTGSAITFSADSGSDHQRWCFDSPQSATRLQLQRGANQSVHTFTGSEPYIGCSGLPLIVGTKALPGQPDQPPAVTFQDVASLTLDAFSSQQDAQSVVGQLHLGPSGTPVLGSPTELVVRARPAAPLHATVLEHAGRSTLTLKSAAATSVMTDSGNLVTSMWDRYQALTLPIFLAIAGGLVPLLLATMQGITSVHRERHRKAKATGCSDP